MSFARINNIFACQEFSKEKIISGIVLFCKASGSKSDRAQVRVDPEVA
jgi:hypothetical protein